MRVIPPIVAALYLLIAWGLHHLFPSMHIVASPYRRLGFLLIGVGAILGVWSLVLFKRGGTPIETYKMPTALVTTGPFRFSRSPMYLGMTALLLGIAIYVGSLPWFFPPIAFALTMHVAYIPHEEATLGRLFGQDYLDYKDRVRRWL